MWVAGRDRGSVGLQMKRMGMQDWLQPWPGVVEYVGKSVVRQVLMR